MCLWRDGGWRTCNRSTDADSILVAKRKEISPYAIERAYEDHAPLVPLVDGIDDELAIEVDGLEDAPLGGADDRVRVRQGSPEAALGQEVSSAPAAASHAQAAASSGTMASFSPRHCGELIFA